MTDRHFLDDTESTNLAQLVDFAQRLVDDARLAQIAVDSFIRLCAARRGLDPSAEYRVTPRGELLRQTPPAGGETEAGPPFRSLFGAIPRERPPACEACGVKSCDSCPPSPSAHRGQVPGPPPGHAEALARIQQDAKARAAASLRTARAHPPAEAREAGETPHPAGG